MKLLILVNPSTTGQLMTLCICTGAPDEQADGAPQGDNDAVAVELAVGGPERLSLLRAAPEVLEADYSCFLS